MNINTWILNFSVHFKHQALENMKLILSRKENLHLLQSLEKIGGSIKQLKILKCLGQALIMKLISTILKNILRPLFLDTVQERDHYLPKNRHQDRVHMKNMI
jgi:hypothetical protein